MTRNDLRRTAQSPDIHGLSGADPIAVAKPPGVRPDLSIVSPVYMAEKILPALCERLTATMEQLGVDYEIILVCDGSPDGSWTVMEQLAKQYVSPLSSAPHTLAPLSLVTKLYNFLLPLILSWNRRCGLLTPMRWPVGSAAVLVSTPAASLPLSTGLNSCPVCLLNYLS